uniref:Centrosomin N-terminal motif 1 domain-containing protein n=1 Tax=Geospiza parvula TaxID=87175 RepID=A0A8U8BC90_GEOPR
MAGGFLGPGASPLSLLSSGAREAWSSRFAGLTAARPCSLPASQEGLWGEGDEEPVPAEPRGCSGPAGAQPQPDPLAQTCLLRDLEMGPLAHTQTLRDFEQVRPRGHLNDLKKENFSLKLRIYFLEERVQQKGEDSRDDVYRRVSACRGRGERVFSLFCEGMGWGECSRGDAREGFGHWGWGSCCWEFALRFL